MEEDMELINTEWYCQSVEDDEFNNCQVTSQDKTGKVLF